MYRLVQLNLTPEIEVFDMLRDISLSLSSLKQLVEYFHFLYQIQSDLPVLKLKLKLIHKFKTTSQP